MVKHTVDFRGIEYKLLCWSGCLRGGGLLRDGVFRLLFEGVWLNGFLGFLKEFLRNLDCHPWGIRFVPFLILWLSG